MSRIKMTDDQIIQDLQDQYGANCANLYNRAPWWYGACWSGSFWGGNGANYQNAAFWNSSGGDYWNYGAYYVK